MSKVHIHEDDEGMRNVYPANAISDVMDDIAAAKLHSVENLAPNGVGWTDVHAIQEPEKSFLEIGLEWQSVANAIGEVLPRIKEFEVGFGTNNPFHYKDLDPTCYGFGQSVYLKLETDGDYLKAIWFDTRSNVEEELFALRRALEAINEIHPSMIADYWLNTGGLIGDQAFLDAYIEDLRGTAVPSTDPSVMKEEPISPTFWSKVMTRVLGTR
ncbi:hypothetical protein [Yoonia sp. BS5-3]|uniref:Uncharacterized protein n=1 Tax=Yoonia phaeophyticola TaxID=3137369 RepID=A0ABZ2V2F0_9RHOB